MKFINKSNLIKTIIVIIIVVFMSNLNALVDHILHPDIPYFDAEHLIVGGISFIFSTIFLIVLNLYLSNLQKTNKKQQELIFELELKKEKIKENQRKLKELIATKDKLFSIIAHDLRSPFNSILGYIDILFEEINESNIDKSLRYLSIIDTSAKNTLLLLDNLLEWARSQSGDLIVKSEKVNLSQIINDTIEGFIPIANSKNIKISYEKTYNIVVNTDINMLTNILRNIINNAIKFTDIGGKVIVTVNYLNEMVEFSVSDNGIGITDEILSNLFSKKGGSTCEGTANEKGYGFGLILCKDFVEKLGGNLLVISEKGKGSDFRFTLPLEKKYKAKQTLIAV